MLCRADSVGVFQVESRAQMATLPRLRPREFYDLVVEVALIRPGPIQGGSVHPYIRRRNGQEEVKHAHPLLENALEKTLGVPLFQEQLMQMAIDVAGFTAAEADELRRAMGAKRSTERMERLRGPALRRDGGQRHHRRARRRDLHLKLAFANYGFPESHAMSFAYLVYASAWLKRYHPAAFCAALLNAQPMGFYSPQSLVDDARRHGVRVRGPDVNASGARAVLEPDADSAGGPAVRLGLTEVRTVGEELAERIEAERTRDGPYRDMADLARRVRLTAPQLEALATAGRSGASGWTGGRRCGRRGRPPGAAGPAAGHGRRPRAPTLPGMTAVELRSPTSGPPGCPRTATDVTSGPARRARRDADRPPRGCGLCTAGPEPGAGRRGGDPPAAAGDRGRGHVPQPGGRDRHAQRDLLAGAVARATGGWRRQRGAAGAGPAGASRGVINLVADRLAGWCWAVPVPSRDFR